MATDLTIRLKRHSYGSASLTLTRADGTVTWHSQKRLQWQTADIGRQSRRR